MKRYRINAPKALGQIIDDEAVIINLETGAYYSLNEPGTKIWDHIAARASFAAIVAGMTQEYHGGADEIGNVVRDFLAQLTQEDLIAEFEADEAGELGAPAPAKTVLKKSILQAPILSKYTDMQDLLLLDPIHEVDEADWPVRKIDPPEPGWVPGAEAAKKDGQ